MLSTFTAPLSHREGPRTGPPKRSAGGQSGNRNAFKHGLYSARHPHPALQQLTQIDSLYRSLLGAVRARQLDLAARCVQNLNDLLIDNFLAADLSHLGPETFVNLDRFYRTVSIGLRAKRRLKQLLDEQNFFTDLARDALPLCTAEFTDRRISPYAYYGQANELFVPPLLRKNRALTNCLCEEPSDDRESTCPGAKRSGFRRKAISSPAPDPVSSQSHGTGNYQPSTGNSQPSTDYCPLPTDHWFPLTSTQWSLLEPILTSHRIQLAEMGIRNRARVYSEHFLIESILTRLAFGLSWDELRGQIPVRACQLLYKQLCTSGRMRLIYEILYQHLQSTGGSDLLALSSAGIYEHTTGRIYISSGGPSEPSEPPSWEQLTGLLLLQRALYNRRRIKQATIRERRRRRVYEREPSLTRGPRRRPGGSSGHRLTSRPRPAHNPPVTQALVPALECTDPLLQRKLRSISDHPPNLSP